MEQPMPNNPTPAEAARQLTQAYRQILPAPPMQLVGGDPIQEYGGFWGGSYFFPISSTPPNEAGFITGVDATTPTAAMVSVLAAAAPLLAPLRPALQLAHASIQDATDAHYLRVVFNELMAQPICRWYSHEVDSGDFRLEPDAWKPGEGDGDPLVYRPPLYGKQAMPAGSYLQAGYAEQPLRQLEELALAAAFPTSEPTAAERRRFTFTRWRTEIQNWQNPDLAGPFIEQLLAKAAPVLMELGFLDLVGRCDSFALFNKIPAMIFLSECLQRMDDSAKKSGSGARPDTTDGAARAAHDSNRNATLQATTKSEPKYDAWAFGVEVEKRCHVFKRQGDRWSYQKLLTGLSAGFESELLIAFASGSGVLSEDAVVKQRQKHPGTSERVRVAGLIKPALSKLRKVLLAQMGVKADERLQHKPDPLPRDRATKSWQARVQIGYAIKEDPDHVGAAEYCFKMLEQLTTDERLDRPTTNC
jgi:hypothetical protein